MIKNIKSLSMNKKLKKEKSLPQTKNDTKEPKEKTNDYC